MRTLNKGVPRNPNARILWRGKSRISITPFDPLPAAPNLEAIKAELERRRPMTDLIDVLMETARQTGFVDAFTTSGDRVILDSDMLRQRLVLCLYDLGTNVGLKRVSAGPMPRATRSCCMSGTASSARRRCAARRRW